MIDRNGTEIQVGDTVFVHLQTKDPVGTVVKLGEQFVEVRIPGFWSERSGGMLPENLTVTDPMDIGL